MWFIKSESQNQDDLGVMNAMYIHYIHTHDPCVTAYYMTFTTRPTRIIIHPEKGEIETDAQVRAFFNHTYKNTHDVEHSASQNGFHHLPDGYRYGTYISCKNEIRHCIEFWSFPSILLKKEQKPMVYQLKYNAMCTFSCRDSNADGVMIGNAMNEFSSTT